jgi:non-canonical poly(A) RNA polymerase PAPD5/7
MHKEIVDFYYYVKPRAFEQAVRTRLVEDLRSRARAAFPRFDIQTFGSFPAGLYLPTSDMDLVCVSDDFMRNGRPVNVTSTYLRGFAKWLKDNRIAHDGSVTTIPKAKVPLVKYVDRLTGLKVDISFENDTGLIANKTFQEWKLEFPAMPTLVTIIKHLLAMRGLNEPQNGGIGGFSVICLVVSLLQQMPQVQSRSMIPEHHYGEVLMEFFDLYGNQFNVTTTAISLKPPGYIPKVSQLYAHLLIV